MGPRPVDVRPPRAAAGRAAGWVAGAGGAGGGGRGGRLGCAPGWGAVLGALARRSGGMAVVEFDVPDLEEGSDAHLARLAERYALGIAEYPDPPEVVAGFLMPVLVEQVQQGRPRLTWEAPAASWAE